MNNIYNKQLFAIIIKKIAPLRHIKKYFLRLLWIVYIGVIVPISNTASIIILALPTSDNNNNNNNNIYLNAIDIYIYIYIYIYELYLLI